MSNQADNIGTSQRQASPNANRRRFLTDIATRTAALSATAGLGFHSGTFASAATPSNDSVGLGFVACGGRAGLLMGRFEKAGGSHVAAICDVDEKRVGLAGERFPNATQYNDLRKLIDDDSVDAVVVATCNHWHCLAAIWAMQAGKDVYVEKPLSHSQWEGQQTVAAARKYDLICQIGTQQRSDPMQKAIQKLLHDDKTLGDIESVRVNRYGVRQPIGKRSEPLPIDKNVAYDLWLGPAADEPIFREKLHYDWHWVWNTGSGEMGNWGVHVLDDVRHNVFRDSVRLPKRIFGGGGRIGYDDAGETPNVHMVQFDTGSIPVTIALSNLPAEKGGKKSPAHPGPASGYLVQCSGGQLHGQRGRAKAVDNDGKTIAEFTGDGSVRHQRNFIDAVVSRDRTMLNAEIAVGNDSTGWCNLANVAYRIGGDFDLVTAAHSGSDVFAEVTKEMETHLAVHGSSINSDDFVGSDWLSVDEKTGQFTGDGSEDANQYLRREYRKGFEVPEIVA